MKILISKEILKKEVKSIKKTSNLKHTQIYQFLLESIGYKNENDYELNRKNIYNKNVLSSLSFEKLYSLEEKIKETFSEVKIIHFIEKAKKEKIKYYMDLKEGYTLSQELLFQPYLYEIENPKPYYFINKNFEIEEEKIYEYLDLVEKRFVKSNISEELYLKVLQKRSLTNDESKIIESFIELKRFQKDFESNNSEDFLVPLLYEYLFKKEEYGKYHFYRKIKERIKLEAKFVNSFIPEKNYLGEKNNEKASLYFPLLSQISKTEKDLLYVNSLLKNKGKNKSILLGADNSFFKNKLLISEKDNLYIRTGISSAGESFSEHILAQNVINNSGFIHFNFQGSHTTFFNMTSKMKAIDENENVYIFTWNNIEELNQQILKSFIYNKKKVVVLFPSFEKMEDEKKLYFSTILLEIINWLKDIKNENKENYIVSFYDTSSIPKKFNLLLEENIDNLNNNNYTVLLSDWALQQELPEDKDKLLKKFNKKILMSSYHFPTSFETFDIFNFDKRLKPLEFIYGEGNTFDTETIYTMPFNDYSVEETLIKIPIGYK